jgi:hypothetical protein
LGATLFTPLRRALALAVGLVAVISYPATAFAYQPESSYSDAAREIGAFVTSVQIQEVAVWIGSDYVRAVQAQEAEQARQEALRAAVRPPVASQPSGSYQALANCEQGGRNHPFFGYFSIMDGSAGGKSWDEQVAMVQAIKARAGAGAWDGCARYVP